MMFPFFKRPDPIPPIAEDRAWIAAHDKGKLTDAADRLLAWAGVTEERTLRLGMIAGADEIYRLRTEVEELKTTLEQIAMKQEARTPEQSAAYFQYLAIKALRPTPSLQCLAEK